MVKVENITSSIKIADVILLFTEYVMELNEDLCFQDFDTEVADPLQKYAEPNGCIFLASDNDIPVGCIALKPLPNNSCEMKRLYVRPDFRKEGIGRILVEKLLQEAKDKKYSTMVLDTLERLQPAIKLYEQFGFEHVSAYYDNPLANVVFMKKKLE